MSILLTAIITKQQNKDAVRKLNISAGDASDIVAVVCLPNNDGALKSVGSLFKEHVRGYRSVTHLKTFPRIRTTGLRNRTSTFSGDWA